MPKDPPKTSSILNQLYDLMTGPPVTLGSKAKRSGYQKAKVDQQGNIIKPKKK